jgi:hypothetical protein
VRERSCFYKSVDKKKKNRTITALSFQGRNFAIC